MKKYDAIVVGAGIGGLAAALLMQHDGKDVLVLEKRPGPGGRLSSFVRDGFKLDLGVHVISRGNKGPVGQVLEMCGCGQPLEFVKVRPLLTFRGEPFKFPQDLAKYTPEDDFNGLMKFMGRIRAMSDEESHEYDDVVLCDMLGEYTDNLLIQEAVGLVNCVYVGVPNYQASAGEFIRCLNWEAAAHSSGYPDGGCIAITAAYVKGFKDQGGTLVCNAPVEKIVVEDGRAVGVVANGEEYRADMIVSDAGIKETILGMLEPGDIDQSYVDYVDGLVYSGTSTIFRFALDKKVTDLKMFSMFDGQSTKESFERIVNGEYDGSSGMFVVVPSNFSDKICDPDKQLVMVAMGLPIDVPDALHNDIKNFIMDYLDDMFAGFKDSIMWIDETSVADLREMLGKNGATIGLAQSAGQVGESRPRTKTPLEGLYLVGLDSDASGVGIEFAINSALGFFNRYVKEQEA